MAKNQQFKDSLKKFRRSLETLVNERALRLGNELSKNIAINFVETARETLRKNSEPLDSVSSARIQQISDSIHYEEDTRVLYGSSNKNRIVAGGYVVRVPIDREGLALFLEYGTGLAGENDRHAEAKDFGWKYAINNNKKRPITTYFKGVKRVKNINWYPTINGKTGFVFRKKGNSYLTQGDVVFKNEHKPYIIKTRHNKNGTTTTYISRNPNAEVQQFDTEYVISSGIKPVRYIYTAKQNARKLIKETKDYKKLMRKLRKKK